MHRAKRRPANNKTTKLIKLIKKILNLVVKQKIYIDTSVYGATLTKSSQNIPSREFEKYENDWENIWRSKVYATTTRQIEREVSQNDQRRNFGIFQKPQVADNNKVLCIKKVFQKWRWRGLCYFTAFNFICAKLQYSGFYSPSSQTPNR